MVRVIPEKEKDFAGEYAQQEQGRAKGIAESVVASSDGKNGPIQEAYLKSLVTDMETRAKITSELIVRGTVDVAAAAIANVTGVASQDFDKAAQHIQALVEMGIRARQVVEKDAHADKVEVSIGNLSMQSRSFFSQPDFLSEADALLKSVEGSAYSENTGIQVVCSDLKRNMKKYLEHREHGQEAEDAYHTMIKLIASLKEMKASIDAEGLSARREQAQSFSHPVDLRNTGEAAGVVVDTTVRASVEDAISTQVGYVDNVPPECVGTAKSHISDVVHQGIEIKSTLAQQSQVQQLYISIGNITTTAAVVVLPTAFPMVDAGHSGRMVWHFSGDSKLGAVTLRIGERTWQEEFARLRLPSGPLLAERAVLTPRGHQVIYDKLCDALAPVDRSVPSHVLVLQGASGLGKTYCVQHYFYHQAASQHHMVAWLSGTSQAAFLQGWCALAQQLRNIQSPPSVMNDDALIGDWCEHQLCNVAINMRLMKPNHPANA